MIMPDNRFSAIAAEVWGRRKWLRLFLFAAPAAALLSLAMNLPNLYSSTATVLVEQHNIAEGFVKPSVTGEADTRLNPIREKLLNRRRPARTDHPLQFVSGAQTRRVRGRTERKDIVLELKQFLQREGSTATTERSDSR